MSEEVLKVENLSFSYPGDNKTLVDINFKVNRGEIVFFHGANGAGKTTLFQCINGLLKMKKGQIKIHNKIIKKEKNRMKLVSIVFQNANDQIIAGSVFDEIAFAPLNMGLSKEEIYKRVENSLKIMDIEDLKDKPPHFLSYGQKKRVAIASVLSMNQEIIILDEPTAGLDVRQTEELIKLLENLSQKGCTLLISTHDAEFSFRCADKIIVVDEGTIICEDSPENIFSNEELLRKTNLLKPIIFEIFESLKKNNIIEDTKIPRNRKDLLSILEK